MPPIDPFSGDLPHHSLMLHGPSSQGDANSFPVLKAFQDYLEMERQQARKRLMTLTIVFSSLMALVVIGFIGAIIFMFGAMSTRQDHILDLALLQKREPLPPTPEPSNSASQQITKEFQAVALNLQTNLGALQMNLGSLQTNLGSQIALVGGAANQLDSKLEAQNGEMAKLRDALAALQKENASMRAELPKLAMEAVRKLPPPATPAPTTIPTPAPMPVAAPNIAPAHVAMPAPAPASPPATAAAPTLAPIPAPPPVSVQSPRPPNTSTASPATTTAGTPAAATGKPPKGYDEAVLSIRTHDGENSIPWRTFIPQ